MSDLDFAQCIKGSYIDESGMLRTGNALALEVSIQVGASTGAILDSPTDCDGVRNINLHSLVGTSNLSQAASAKVQYSPSDTDDIWIDVGMSLASATGQNTVSTSTAVSSLLARRVRLYLSTAPVGGDVTYYLIGN
jgi:hypothetical protein